MLENKMDEVIYKKFKDEPKKHKKTKNSLINNINLPKQDKKNSIFKKKKKQKKSVASTNNNIKSKNLSNNILLNQEQNKNIGNNNYTSVLENKNKKSRISENSQIKPDKDYEYNWLSYEEALKYDKRTNCDYYGSLIRNKQLFIFTFCSFNDYNSGVIKKFMFFLSFALHYTVNALFLTEKTMHQIYEDEGKFNFKYQYPKIIFSAVISAFVLRLMLHILILTDKDILQVKLQITKIKANDLKQNKLKCMKIKFAIFFILNFILLCLFWYWYYLTCFNAVYQNTQVYLIENTFISFAFSLVYPFVINIFPTMMRMGAIHSTNKDKECFYKASQIIQLI